MRIVFVKFIMDVKEDNKKPIKNEIYEPIKTPIQQYIPPNNGPYIRLPTMHITDAGIGKNITCNN